MPESKRRKTPERNRMDVNAHNARVKAENDEIVEAIMEGLDIRVDHDAGRVVYDMDRITRDALTAYAESKGLTLDDFLRENIRRTMGKVADLRRRAEKDRNAADLERVTKELARSTAELDAIRAAKRKG